ncbi:hypothetical protein POM88_047657 [Heracleum sosnowskyi]|uniref:Uncharacterized protein n=1 Tax=Heracleum sosnowskyi TaxID=360622 RepID=A0AAD8GUR3_9APIA|nr:hypothetical protein POM88_047657 [Heracleum sosnowskyi]
MEMNHITYSDAIVARLVRLSLESSSSCTRDAEQVISKKEVLRRRMKKYPMSSGISVWIQKRRWFVYAIGDCAVFDPLLQQALSLLLSLVFMIHGLLNLQVSLASGLMKGDSNIWSSRKREKYGLHGGDPKYNLLNQNVSMNETKANSKLRNTCRCSTAL